MIRDRLKTAARKAALKFFNMEWDAQESAGPPPAWKDQDKQDIKSYIPPVVDGSGDTPGPNHRTRIGRTWLAAQVISGTGPLLVDLRPPKECAAGMLPGALLIPYEQLKTSVAKLPGKETAIVVYDQVGGEASDEAAEWLRQQGWAAARQLAGGYAEWIEYSEPTEVPQPPKGGRYHIGNPVEQKGGSRGYVQGVSLENGRPAYTILLDNGKVVGPLTEDQLVP